MRRFDFSPLYRQTIGFDHLANLIEQLATTEGDNGFPPYNIERLDENEYRITMAVAGFANDDLNIEVKEGTLSVRGEKKPRKSPTRTICTEASPPAISSAASASPNMSR